MKGLEELKERKNEKKHIPLYLAIAPVITALVSLITVPNKKIGASYFPRKERGWVQRMRDICDQAYYYLPVNIIKVRLTLRCHRLTNRTDCPNHYV